MTKVSSSYLFHNLGGFTTHVRVLCSKDSIYKFATIGLTGDPIAAPLGLLIKFSVIENPWNIFLIINITKQNEKYTSTKKVELTLHFLD